MPQKLPQVYFVIANICIGKVARFAVYIFAVKYGTHCISHAFTRICAPILFQEKLNELIHIWYIPQKLPQIFFQEKLLSSDIDYARGEGNLYSDSSSDESSGDEDEALQEAGGPWCFLTSLSLLQTVLGWGIQSESGFGN